MFKYLSFLNAIPGYEKMPETTKLALIFFILAILWLISGLVLPSNAVQELAPSIKVRNEEIRIMSVKSTLFSAQKQIETIILRGYTEADRNVTLAAQTSGRIAKLPIKKGTAVRAGDIICQIDVDARQAQLEEAQALMRAREIDYTAAQQLVEKGHYSKSRAALAKAAYDTALALRKQRAIELERTKIRAPFAGILDTLPVEIGDFIAIGQPCGNVVDKNPLIVAGQISEAQVGGLIKNAKARAKLTTGEEVNGTLRYVSETADPRTRTFLIEVEIPNADGKLRDGVSADIYLSGNEIEAHLLPQGIITLSTDGRIGVNVVENETARFMPITILSDDLRGVLVSGLTGTVEIITVGQDFVRDGLKISVTRLNQTQ